MEAFLSWQVHLCPPIATRTCGRTQHPHHTRTLSSRSHLIPILPSQLQPLQLLNASCRRSEFRR